MELTSLDPSKQFCFNPDCPDYGVVGKGNTYVHSYKERRYGCHTCKRTFVESKGTMFYRLRTPPREVLDAIAQLVERGSIRGVARAKGVRPDTVIAWLRLAGEHMAQINEYLIRDLHLTQVQVDELWTFVKKSRRTSRQSRKQTATMAI
jgi:transposase-like protein